MNQPLPDRRREASKVRKVEGFRDVYPCTGGAHPNPVDFSHPFSLQDAKQTLIGVILSQLRINQRREKPVGRGYLVRSRSGSNKAKIGDTGYDLQADSHLFEAIERGHFARYCYIKQDLYSEHPLTDRLTRTTNRD